MLDAQVLALVEINPEVRVKAIRGLAKASIQQHGFTPLLLKIHNMAHVETALNVHSPNAGPVYAGGSVGILKRQEQTELAEGENVAGEKNRFLEAEVFRAPPLTARLSGLDIEYVLLNVSSTAAGRREALLQFDVGQGTQDLGFRGEVPVLFHAVPAISICAQDLHLTKLDKNAPAIIVPAFDLYPEFFTSAIFDFVFLTYESHIGNSQTFSPILLPALTIILFNFVSFPITSAASTSVT